MVKRAGSPAHSRVTGEQGLFSSRIRATESPCVLPHPQTHTHTHPAPPAACARACVCTRSVCLPKKSQQRDPPKIGEEHHHHLTSNYFLFICRLSDDFPPLPHSKGRIWGKKEVRSSSRFGLAGRCGWMMGSRGTEPHPRHPPTPGVSRKPDLPKESSAGPAHLPPPQGARSPTPRACGFTSPRCPRQGSGVASETRKQGCGSDCCFGREIHPGMGRVPGRFRLNSSAEISLEHLRCKVGLWELSSWFGWDGGGEAGGGRWEAGEEH